LGNILGNFFANLSGHPGSKLEVAKGRAYRHTVANFALIHPINFAASSKLFLGQGTNVVIFLKLLQKNVEKILAFFHKTTASFCIKNCEHNNGF
jgi:hypothetical protein